MSKSILRSIRFSEESIEIIDSIPGNSFSGRLENLISRYALQHDTLEIELADLEAKIAQARLKLKILQSICDKLEDLDATICSANQTVQDIASKALLINFDANNINT